MLRPKYLQVLPKLRNVWKSDIQSHVPGLYPCLLRYKIDREVIKYSAIQKCSTTSNSDLSMQDVQRIPVSTPKAVNVTDNATKVSVVWADGKSSSFHSVWLRFNCQCPRCRDPQINVGLLTYHEMMDTLRLEFNEDGHQSEFTLHWLKDKCYSKESLKRRRNEMKPVFHLQIKFDTNGCFCNAKIMSNANLISFKEGIPEVQFSEIEASDAGLYKWLKQINEYGLCLLKNVPTIPGTLAEVIKKMGPIQDTAFGGMYELHIHEVPIDLAYSNSGLQFHTDLPCYESPPGIQFLHCIKFDESIKGGETVFLDLVHAALLFKEQHPKKYHTLTTVPCSFQRIQERGGRRIHLEQRRPAIQLNNEDEIISIRWSPTYLGVPYLDEVEVEPFYKAFQLFARALNDYKHKKRVRWNPGDLIGFNNHRMAHGRDTFEITTGERYLQGGYLNIDDYRSRLICLAKQHGHTGPGYSVFNSNWL